MAINPISHSRPANSADASTRLQGPAAPRTGELAGTRCHVGSGENRSRAQSAVNTIKGLFASLSNALKTVLHSPVALLKGMQSYAMRIGNSELAQRIRQEIKEIPGSLRNFINSSSTMKDAVRALRDFFDPPASGIERFERRVTDGFSDVGNTARNFFRN